MPSEVYGLTVKARHLRMYEKGIIKETTMKLIDIIKKLNLENADRINIQYRTFLEDNDLYIGACHYSNGTLIPDDQDTYHLDDEVLEYDFYTDTFSGKHYLTCWYQSSWEK